MGLETLAKRMRKIDKMEFKKFVCTKCENVLEIEASLLDKYDGWTCPNCGERNELRKNDKSEEKVL
jgi:predicted RNA-binding Zn-ribbon protein involved in translation (DUF1610 family)